MRARLRSLLPLTIALFVSDLVGGGSVRRKPQTSKKWTIQMIGYSPDQKDDYVAVTMPAPTGYIVGFEPLADADRVHHILLYGCTEPAQKAKFWKGGATCGSGSTHILYAWARNAPSLYLPEGVAFAVGDTSDIKYIVLQVHYANPFAGSLKDYSGVTLVLTEEQPPNLAAVMLMVTGQPIPPRMPQFQDNMSCIYNSDTVIHPFAFRTHTHLMGRLVSAFFKHEGQWNMIGRRNPQWPQLFEKIDKKLEIKRGDLLAGTCRFDSSDKDVSVPMGHMGVNEMCNFYMMFYWSADDPNPFPYGAVCSGRSSLSDMDDYPRAGTDMLPARPELEHHAHQSSVPFGFVEEAKVERIGDLKLGQVSGLTFDNDGNLVIFHRASRVWMFTSFDTQNRLKDKTPIKEDVILTAKFNGNSSTLVRKEGAGMFYMPHGIYVDKEGAIYATDVGSHTVSKIVRQADGKLNRMWEIGEKLVPGSDSAHFCMPTSIVRLGDSLFLADGYCNARVVEISLDGKIKNSFGSYGNAAGQFFIPHDIVVSPAGNLIVADRENGRVKELRSDGTEVSVLNSSLFNNIYSADFYGENIYLIPGELRQASFGGAELPIQVFAGRSGTGLVEFSFSGMSGPFTRPHAMRICPHGEHIFIADIGDMSDKAASAALWKFKVQREGGSDESTGHGTVTSTGDRSTSRSLPKGSAPLSFVLFCVIVAGIVLSGLYVKRKFVDNSATSSRFDRAGFKPLKTDDALNFSSDEESDG